MSQANMTMDESSKYSAGLAGMVHQAVAHESDLLEALRLSVAPAGMTGCPEGRPQGGGAQDRPACPKGAFLIYLWVFAKLVGELGVSASSASIPLRRLGMLKVIAAITCIHLLPVHGWDSDM